MNRCRKRIDRFMRDKDGHQTLWQTPNIPLIVWILATGVSFFLHGESRVIDHRLATIFLSIWAYLEITAGSSPFRRTLGVVVAVVIIYGIITQ